MFETYLVTTKGGGEALGSRAGGAGDVAEGETGGKGFRCVDLRPDCACATLPKATERKASAKKTLIEFRLNIRRIVNTSLS